MAASIGTTARLGNVLVERGYLTVDGLEAALVEQKKPGKHRLLGEVLIDTEACTEDQVMECLAVEYGVPYAKLDARMYDAKIVDILSRDYIEKQLVLPLYKIRDVLTVAVAEPSNLFQIDELSSLTGLEIQIVASTTKDIRRRSRTCPIPRCSSSTTSSKTRNRPKSP
jgi:type IV pilus assembly protein PilB